MLGALLAFLYSSNPGGRYSFLFASLLVCLYVLFVALWLSFSLWRRSDGKDAIVLTPATDYKYLAARFTMYFGLMLAFVHFVLFCLGFRTASWAARAG